MYMCMYMYVHCTCVSSGSTHKGQSIKPLHHYVHIRIYMNMYMVHTGGEAVGGSYFGMGSGDLFFSQFSCSESNTRLRECSFEAVQSQFCSTHSNDAGVICTGTMYVLCTEKNSSDVPNRLCLFPNDES